jgi:hypothetical protein
VETSLAVLDERRLARLQAAGCRLLATGVESWSAYSAKAGMAPETGQRKLELVLGHLETVSRHVPFVQATFILGLDCDEGEEPFALTEAFIRRAPDVWPYLNVPFAYGGTPFHARAKAEGRLLATMPFSCYKNPYLTVRLAHYDPIAYMDGMARLHGILASPRQLSRHLAAARTPAARLEHLVRAVSVRPYARALRSMADLMRRDGDLHAFHEGRSGALPDLYRAVHARQLGPFAELMPAEDACPLAETDDLVPLVVGAAS